MNIGYGFWGFLGDKKFNKEGKEISTPDGNAFYSWSILSGLQKKEHDVFALMPDRDEPGIKLLGTDLFNAFASDTRFNSYCEMQDYLTEEDMEDVINGKLALEEIELTELDAVIWEWRMPIPGRNTQEMMGKPDFQPDLLLQDLYLSYFKRNHVPVYAFDLDYKLTKEDIIKYNINGVLELGNKWTTDPERICKAKWTVIPFDYKFINDFEIKEPTENIVYIGNRYERDWCIDKYIPEDLEGVTVHGNWLEGNRDSANKWPKINFAKRLQLSEMYEAYSKAAVTPLFAKEDYCKYSFMTARIVEAVLYGCLPLLIDEFTGSYSYITDTDLIETITVKNKEELESKAIYYRTHPKERETLIRRLRYELSTTMNVNIFINDLLDIIEE